MILRIKYFGLDMACLGFGVLIMRFLGRSPYPVVINIQLRHSLPSLSGSRCINILLPILLHTLHCQSPSF